MPDSEPADALHRVRRRDRAVEDDAWIRSMLHRAALGTLATASDGQPFVNTNLFAFDEPARALYIHTAAEGRTRATVEANPRVCFTASEMGRLLPSQTARGFSVEYAGVVVFGRATIVTDEAEARHGLQILLDKYFPHLQPGRDYTPIAAEEMADTAVFRIDIEHWSGKKKEAAADFPGAFFYRPAGDISSG